MASQLERPSRISRINNAGDSRVERFTNNTGDTVYGDYDRHSYLREKGLDQLGNTKSPINKAGSAINATKNVLKKGVTFNFICMALVAATLDILSFFLSAIPGVGIIFSILSLVIFMPWFAFSGVIKIDDISKMISMAFTAIGEGIPVIGNLPCITINVFFTYYS